MKLKLNLMIMVIILLQLTGCSQNNSTYPSSVIINDTVYGISVSEVSADKIGEKLGEILKNRQPMPIENWESNEAPIGSEIFEIKDIDRTKAITIKLKDKMIKAERILEEP
ncbi:MAG: hypothetical protein ACE3L7_13410 [Candidatus Pristimantibacillus sp.]